MLINIQPIRYVVAGAIAIGFATPSSFASAETVAEFYRGRQIDLMIPFGAGGLTAAFGRTVGLHLGKHIPGNPNVVLKFLPGAGGARGTNYCYSAAPRDGSYICMSTSGQVFTQMLRPKKVRYDMGAFEYIGSGARINGSIGIMNSVPVKTFAELRSREIVIGGTSRFNEGYTDPVMLNHVFGTKFKMVMGYKGGGELDLAIQRGEIQGRAGPLLAWWVRKRDWIRQGKVRILVQIGLEKSPNFPNVPLLSEFAKTEDQKRIVEFFSSRSEAGRVFFLPPATPNDRVSALRKAFVATMADPAYIADATRIGFPTNTWMNGRDVQGLMKRILSTPKEVVALTRQYLGYK